MQERIDYHIEKYQFRARNESPRLMRQWADVMRECRETGAGARERLRTALLNVDYVTSFELPFRLLLTRTPQMIDTLRGNGCSVRKKPCSTGGSGDVYTVCRMTYPACRIVSATVLRREYGGWTAMA
ncbi:hypothetical protein G742_04717 [Escherichia coli HVH 79 (4-2512823)]|jgi:hypothetical protein|nr:hypothetical protein G742_04717 [Escherichia coli HVH 79 (4-2512823)]